MNSCGELTRAALAEALAGFSRARVALVGDFCLDLYWMADMRLSELSRETPRFPLPVVAERHSPGGAGNVACNLAALGPASVAAIGVTGWDWRGELLRGDLRAAGVDDALLLCGEDAVTNAYVKPVRMGFSGVASEDARIDFEGRALLPPALEEEICRALDASEFDALLVSDQLRFGAVTPRVREKICQIGASGKTVIVDSRDRAGEYRNVIVKPNEVEAARLVGTDIGAMPRDALVEFALDAARKLAARNGARSVVTLGDMGCVVCDGEGARHCPAVKVSGPIDIVGAGDTFLAAMGCALASGQPLDAAARIACLASSVTIAKVGVTGTASRGEIMAALR